MISSRRGTGAFIPKDVCQKQLLTGAKGYRLRDTDDRISRLRESGTNQSSEEKISATESSDKKALGTKGNKDIGPPLNHMGKKISHLNVTSWLIKFLIF